MSSKVIIFLFSSPLKSASTSPFLSTTTEFDTFICKSSLLISISFPYHPFITPIKNHIPAIATNIHNIIIININFKNLCFLRFFCFSSFLSLFSSSTTNTNFSSFFEFFCFFILSFLNLFFSIFCIGVLFTSFDLLLFLLSFSCSSILFSLSSTTNINFSLFSILFCSFILLLSGLPSSLFCIDVSLILLEVLFIFLMFLLFILFFLLFLFFFFLFFLLFPICRPPCIIYFQN